MYCNVKLRKLLSANNSHGRETSLLTGAIPNPVRNNQTSHFVSVPENNPGRSNRGDRQRGATAAVGDDGGRAVVQEVESNRPVYRFQITPHSDSPLGSLKAVSCYRGVI